MDDLLQNYLEIIGGIMEKYGNFYLVPVGELPSGESEITPLRLPIQQNAKQ